MATLEKTVRSAAITVAVLFIGLSLFAIVGVWFVDRKATEISRKGVWPRRDRRRCGRCRGGTGGRPHRDEPDRSATGCREHQHSRRAGAGEQSRAQRAERAPRDESWATHRADAAGVGSGAVPDPDGYYVTVSALSAPQPNDA